MQEYSVEEEIVDGIRNYEYHIDKANLIEVRV